MFLGQLKIEGGLPSLTTHLTPDLQVLDATTRGRQMSVTGLEGFLYALTALPVPQGALWRQC